MDYWKNLAPNGESKDIYTERLKELFLELKTRSPRGAAEVILFIFEKLGPKTYLEKRESFLRKLSLEPEVTRLTLAGITFIPDFPENEFSDKKESDDLEEFLQSSNKLVRLLTLIQLMKYNPEALALHISLVLPMAAFRTSAPGVSMLALQILMVSRYRLKLRDRLKMISFSIPLKPSTCREFIKYLIFRRALSKNQRILRKNARLEYTIQ